MPKCRCCVGFGEDCKVEENLKMKEGNPQVDSNPEEGLDEPDKSKADHSDEQKKDLLSRYPWIVPIIAAIVFSFFGLNAQKVWVLITMIIYPRPENKAINYPLANENLVENNQGQVHYTDDRSLNNFDKGGCKAYGFISIEAEDVILFPVPAELMYLDRGTIAFCVTPKRELDEKSRFSLFRAHNESKEITLKVTPRDDPKGNRRYHEVIYRLRRAHVS